MGKRPDRQKAFEAEPGTNTNNLNFLIKLTAWKNNDPIRIEDTDSVKYKVEKYFEMAAEADHKPTLTELSIVLGVPREYIYRIVSGRTAGFPRLANLPQENVNIIKDAYNIVQGNVESMLADGKINPVSGIFLAKNMGIKDTNDMFDDTTQKEKPDIERLKAQYLNQLPQKDNNDE